MYEEEITIKIRTENKLTRTQAIAVLEDISERMRGSLGNKPIRSIFQKHKVREIAFTLTEENETYDSKNAE